MSNEQKTKKEQPAQVVLGPGAILKAAREKNGLTIADIAGKLHLKQINIESIEADEYDPSVALTFTKGYLKLYARQVSVPENDVLEAFASLNVEGKEPAKLQSFSRRVAKQANDDRLMMITYGVIAVVAALVIIWWLQQDSVDVVKVPDAHAPLTQAKVDQPLLVAANDISKPAAEKILENVQSTPEDLIVSAQFDVTSEDDDEELDAELFTADTVEPIAAANQKDVNESEASKADAIELVFEFADNCWMNLVDSTGEAIAYGVKKSGRVMTVAGISPFEITLGAPQVVSIIYDGVPVDMSRFAPGISAKFTLPFTE